MKFSRRTFLGSGASSALLAALPKQANALPSGNSFASGHNGKRIMMNVYEPYPFLNCFKTAQPWYYGNNMVLDPYLTPLDANGYPIGKNVSVYTFFNIPPTSERPGQYVFKGNGSGNIRLANGHGNNMVAPKNVTDSGSGWRFKFDIPLITDTQLYFYLNSTSAAPNNIRNIVFCHVDDEATLAAGGVFQTRFKSFMAYCGVLRFMDMQNITGTNVVNWADRPPIDHYSYGNGYNYVAYMPSQHCYDTATQTPGGGLNNLAYTITIPGFSLVDKARIICRFDKAPGSAGNLQMMTSITKSSGAGQPTTIGLNGTPNFVVGQQIFIPYFFLSAGGTLANDMCYQNPTVTNVDNIRNTIQVNIDTHLSTGTFNASAQSYLRPIVTLSINGGTAIPIGNEGGLPQGNQVFSVAKSKVSTLVYDATLGTFVCSGAGINGGWPPEICVQLCNEVGAHPWFCIPLLACDAQGNLPTLPDYTTQLATYSKNNLKAGLIPRFEPSNEIWNNTARRDYAVWRQWKRNVSAVGSGLSSSYLNVFDFNNWYGQASSEIGQLVSAVYSGDMTKYQIIVGWQLWGGYTGTWVYRLTCPVYYFLSGNDASKYAYKWATHIAGASYWRSAYYDGTYESSQADLWAVSDPTTQAAIIDDYIQGAMGPGDRKPYNGHNAPQGQTIPNVKGQFDAAYAFATSYTNNAGNVLKLTMYEGGFEAPWNGSGNLVNFRATASKSTSSYLLTYTQTNWNNLLNEGVNAEFPSEYTFVYGSTWGIWWPDTYNSTIPARWTAIATF